MAERARSDGSSRWAHEAMGTTFEIFIAGQDPAYGARAAAAAFQLVDAIEAETSHYLPSSDISALNRRQPGDPLVIGVHAMACLEQGLRLHKITGGAFDPTVGALYACWRIAREESREPTERDIAEALRKTGVQHIVLDPVAYTVDIRRKGVRLDLGAIGKGYAIQEAARQLQEWSISEVLLSGGGSTVLALDPPAPQPGWPVKAGHGRKILLSRRALSASGRAVKGAHIFDPRSGQPARSHVRAWAYASTAIESDALSTAFMVMSKKEIREFCADHAGIGAQVQSDEAGTAFSVFGAWPSS